MVRATALAIFAAALVCRLLFWRATPDRDWAWTAFFKGDAPLWLEYARAIERGQPFELGLPIHPPGTAWLVSILWNGLPSGIAFLRFVWVLLGALVPLLVFFAVRRSFSLRAATFAGVWTALSTAVLVLSTSINNEVPYLVFAVGAMWFVEDLRERPTTGKLALWSAVNGIACLFRVEHVLFFIFALAFFAIGWLRRNGSRGVKWAAASLFFFALPLLPWHLSAWSAIRRFNEEPRRLAPAEEEAITRVERRLAGLEWDDGALARKSELPAFLRRTASDVVAATVAHRGRRRVRAEDFEILEEALRYFPRPLRRYPFVSSYGPLNFYLANNPSATGGFDRRPLEEPPPLLADASRYPPDLVVGLPPKDLSFVYPPHLELFNEGYSLGARWIVAHPGDFARLAIHKLRVFWSGAASGFTGYNLPLGLSGLRRSVDMVAPEGGPASAVWQILVLLAATVGIVAGWRRAALAPWVLFLASKVAVTVLFFGYVRQGALVVPVVALLAALGVERWILRGAAFPRPRRFPAVALALAAGVGIEAARFVAKPVVRIDGLQVAGSDPLPADEHRRHSIAIE